MKKELTIDSELSDLELISVSVESSLKMSVVYKIFENNNKIPGVILLQDGKFFKMLSKIRLFEGMSKQFGFELFAKRQASYFFDHTEEDYLIVPQNTSILEASTRAITRNEQTKFEPIIVDCQEDGYKLLDYFTLLLAENTVHILTSNSLTKANEFKKLALSVVSHDLINPINSIMGFSSLLAHKEYDREKTTHYANLINEASEFMHSIVKDFMISAMNDFTEYTLNVTKFDIVMLVNSVIEHVKISIKRKQQKIYFHCSEKYLFIEADKNKIWEIVNNLLSNAVKYSPFEKQIVVNLQLQLESVLISVKDEGLGLTDEDKTKVFGKFQTLSSKPTNNESSTGLGLYIAKQFVDLHKGNIWVESEVGKGSTFFVSLPIVKSKTIVLQKKEDT